MKAQQEAETSEVTKKSIGEEMKQVKQEALGALKEARKLEPSLRSLIHMVWDPKYPTKSPGDDDLEVFYGDQEFETFIKS